MSQSDYEAIYERTFRQHREAGFPRTIAEAQARVTKTPTGVREALSLPDLFEQKVMATPTRLLRGMVRGTDPIESQASAVRIASDQKRLTEIQTRIMHELVSAPLGLTAKELEAMVWARGYGPSTVRKRCVELCQMGKIERTDDRREGCAVLRIAP